ncbi:MAG: MltA:3D [Rhodocyclaceae bacterium]|nr:MltA:3D [Rhodocyclaceae bacterium]
MQKLHAAAVLGILLLTGCAGVPPASVPAQTPAPALAAPCPACPACPPATVVTPSLPPAKPLQPAAWQDMEGWADDDLAAAWPAFLQSCRGLAGRPQGAAWKRVCAQAKKLDSSQAGVLRSFFEANFRPYAVVAADGNSAGLITGYYEPLLKGSRQGGRSYPTPVLGVPDDLVTVDLGELYPDLKHLRLRGRLVGKKVVPYYSRGEITAQDGKVPARTLLWVEDPVEFFFLQVQGSGRVRLPDGSLVRLAYADQNGHPYHSIGRLLIERGELKLEDASMQGIQAWGRANPARLADLLNANPSYVFFREAPSSNDGPTGSLGVPLVAGRSLAVDPRAIPLGAPVFLSTTRPNSAQPLNRLMLAQDTGGAIKGAVRADFFWGFGKEAGEQAGRMRQTGRLWVLLPAEAAPK